MVKGQCQLPYKLSVVGALVGNPGGYSVSDTEAYRGVGQF